VCGTLRVAAVPTGEGGVFPTSIAMFERNVWSWA
jgi:hypothetical protein